MYSITKTNPSGDAPLNASDSVVEAVTQPQTAESQSAIWYLK